jgi:hypothetical protein
MCTEAAMYFLQTVEFGVEQFDNVNAAAIRAVILARQRGMFVILGRNRGRQLQDLTRAIDDRLY